MLLTLTILDLAIVKALQLDLMQGMTVLTGETGAGKSILLTALGLALGDRATADYVRPNCKRAEVNLEFDLTASPAALTWLQANDFDDNQQCLIRRLVNSDGRSKAYINNRPVTLQMLQFFTRQLVEIHGQHAHLTLLESDEQRRLLDNYGKHSELLERVNGCFRNWQTAQHELQHLQKKRNVAEQREALLRYQLDELEALKLAQFDYDALSETHRKLANLDQILSVGQHELDVFYDADKSTHWQLKNSLKALTHLQQFAPELTAVNALLTEAQIQIEEAAYELRHFLENQEADPAQLMELEQQIGVLQDLSRKHQVKPNELLAFQQRLENELAQLSHSGERIAELEQLTADYQQAYVPLAAELSAQRQKSAKKLQQQISHMMKELGMPNGEFLVDVNALVSDTPKLNGNDNVTFLISANVGLPPKPLAKVASGGELSRISLAIQVTTASDKTTPTMIFDEVDSGIGGGIAEIVGQKLRQLSGNRQVLCVTHLPQVAAQAHQHLYVEKQHHADMTASQVRLLTDEDRVIETARMLGGVELTANTLAHAREMLFKK
ncbi:MAG: DNA repair protein RecN [Methylococcales bacterium]|nr:DNA repair protein RecN [Methylococcales bacterium]MDD5753463.1 DNA repair protein RecN [Methylococcales bacterium]